ncbi:hypothetical protein ACLB2K_005544 [Fragaria x ananassa]
MKSTMLSFLIVLLSVQMLLAANPPPPPPPVPALDSYNLVIEWPNTFCLVEPQPPCQQHPQSFTLHGLWPQAGGRSLVNCPGSPMEDQTLEANKGDLTKFWPDLRNSDFDKSKSFWRHEWDTHGRCSGKPPADYLTMVFNAVKKYDVQKLLAKNGILPGNPKGHMAAQFEQAIFKETKLHTEIECKTEDRKEYLFQIYFCLTPQGQFKNCTIRYRCANKPIYMPLPPPSP